MVGVFTNLRSWYRKQWHLPFEPLFSPGASWVRFVGYLIATAYLILAALREIAAGDGRPFWFLVGAVIFGIAFVKQWKKLG